MESIASYKTQFPPEKSYVFDRVRGAALATGALGGFEAGESFVSAKTLRTQNMMKFLEL